jgi:hypothetical protein
MRVPHYLLVTGVSFWEDGRPLKRQATAADMVRSVQVATLHVSGDEVTVKVQPLCGTGGYYD